jgi:hypothetical protein
MLQALALGVFDAPGATLFGPLDGTPDHAVPEDRPGAAFTFELDDNAPLAPQCRAPAKFSWEI